MQKQTVKKYIPSKRILPDDKSLNEDPVKVKKINYSKIQNAALNQKNIFLKKKN